MIDIDSQLYAKPDGAFGRALAEYSSQNGWNLRELSGALPVMVVFLRHLGCVYCLESLERLRRIRHDVEAQNVRIALVQMGTHEQAKDLLSRFGLEDLETFSDPSADLYRAFGLERTSIGKLVAPGNWLKYFRTMVSDGFRPGKPVGDVLQMPGVFLLSEAKIIADFKHEKISDQPNYLEIAALKC